MIEYITIENGVGKSSLFDNKITFTFNKDKTVSITADKNSKLNGKYSKTGEYSDDVYYKDIVGDKTYLTKEINGKYLKEVETELKDKNETNESERTEEINMYVIQTSENKGSLIIPNGNIISVYVDFEISPDNQLKGINPNTNVNDFFLITFTSDGFEFTSKEMNLESYNGKYVKKSGLTQQEVIDIITPK